MKQFEEWCRENYRISADDAIMDPRLVGMWQQHLYATGSQRANAYDPYGMLSNSLQDRVRQFPHSDVYRYHVDKDGNVDVLDSAPTAKPE
jgi:hypothetical protein